MHDSSLPAPTPGPLLVALLGDCEIITAGLRTMLAPYADRVVVVDAPTGPRRVVDIALADPDLDEAEVTRLLREANAAVLIRYSWTPPTASTVGWSVTLADGSVDKRLGALALVQVLERIAAGRRGPARLAQPEPWSGFTAGLTQRESETLALIASGLSNRELADRSFLSINTVKSNIRRAYAKIGVGTRSQAVIWAHRNGFSQTVFAQQTQP